jgi:NTP pyrophosphatase (non-canonical NTP hydrolase)
VKRTPGLDPQTTLAELRRAVQQFVEERDWAQFHTPKNLAMSIAIEAAEMMEHFQWLTPDESEQALEKPSVHAEIEVEFADIMIYMLSFANQANIDISQAVISKVDRNKGRFPVGYMPS